jgi:hypothetical protein
MARTAKLSFLLVLGVLVIAAGQGAPALAGGGRTLTVAQMVFLGDVPYATSYTISVAPGYSSGGATIYKFTGSGYFAGDLGKLTEMGFDLGRAAGRLVFGALVPANVLIEVAAFAFVNGSVMAEGRYDLGSFGHAVQHLMLDPAQNTVHGHISIKAVAPAINMIGDITAPISATATYEKEKITGLVQYGAQLTAALKLKHKQHDRRDPELEGSVYVRNMTLTVLSQTAWTFSGEIVAALSVDP